MDRSVGRFMYLVDGPWTGPYSWTVRLDNPLFRIFGDNSSLVNYYQRNYLSILFTTICSTLIYDTLLSTTTTPSSQAISYVSELPEASTAFVTLHTIVGTMEEGGANAPHFLA